MAKIEVNSYDLCIGKTKDGDEVVQFKNGFDADFVQEMKDQGVRERAIKAEKDEEEEE